MAGGEPTYGFIPEVEGREPRYGEDHLYETVGYVVEINVEQETTRQALHFMLRIYYGIGFAGSTSVRDQKCKIYLDVNTTTALAQLQLLRDAMWSNKIGVPFLVHIHFNFAHPDDEEWAYVYWLSSLLRDTSPVKVGEFRGTFDHAGPWYFHES